MEKIIDPVDVALIKSELTPDKRLGDTNKGGNVLYVVSWKDSPNTVREIGRLREVSYREAGASSGKSIDLDEYDTMEVPYSQLIVWDRGYHRRLPLHSRSERLSQRGRAAQLDLLPPLQVLG